MQEMHENTHIPESSETAALDVETEQSEQLEKPEKPRPPVKTRTSPLVSFIAVLSLFLALAAAGAWAYSWQKWQAIHQDEQAKIASLAKAAAKDHDLLTTQTTTLQSTQQNVAQLDTQLQQMAKPKDWLLVGVDYQVKLAALNLAIDNNIPLARKLLQAADQQMADANNVALLPVRQALANDIAALNKAPQADIPGAIVKLNSLKSQIEQLPQTPNLAEAVSLPKAAPHAVETKSTAWLDKAKDFVEQVGASFKDLVVIRTEGAQSAPLLPPAAHAFLVTNIQAQLTMAQWAALHHQGDIYQQSIKQANDWIGRYFAVNDPQVKAAQALLNELAAIDVSPVTVDLSASLAAIQKLL